MYLYKAWRTPLFLLVSWGRTESLEENQPPREERRGPQQPVGQDEATSYEGEDPSDSSSNSQRVFCSFPTFHFSVPLQEPPSSAPEQFSWTVNRNSHRLWAHGTSGWSFARHTPSLTTASPQPWWPQPFSYHSQPSAIVTTPLLLPQPALSHGDHTPSPTTASPQPWWSYCEHLCGTWFPPEAEERPTLPQLLAGFSPALIWSALGSLWSLEDLFSVVENFF